MASPAGGSFESCHVNVFNLCDISGLNWCCLVPTTSVVPEAIESCPVLRGYKRVQSENASSSSTTTQDSSPSPLCLWRRKPSTLQTNSSNVPSPAVRISSHRELWLFWYPPRPDDLIKALTTIDGLTISQDYPEDSWLNTGLDYPIRTLFFKALHNALEKRSLDMGYVRFGRWFCRPLRPLNIRPKSIPTYQLAFGYEFFVLGDRKICLLVKTQRQPTLLAVTKDVILRNERLPVILGPWSLRGILLPNQPLIDYSTGEEVVLKKKTASDMADFSVLFNEGRQTEIKRHLKKAVDEEFDKWKDFLGAREFLSGSFDENYPKPPPMDSLPTMLAIELDGVKYFWPTDLIAVPLETLPQESESKFLDDKIWGDFDIVENRTFNDVVDLAGLRICQRLFEDAFLRPPDLLLKRIDAELSKNKALFPQLFDPQRHNGCQNGCCVCTVSEESHNAVLDAAAPAASPQQAPNSNQQQVPSLPPTSIEAYTPADLKATRQRVRYKKPDYDANARDAKEARAVSALDEEYHKAIQKAHGAITASMMSPQDNLMYEARNLSYDVYITWPHFRSAVPDWDEACGPMTTMDKFVPITCITPEREDMDEDKIEEEVLANCYNHDPRKRDVLQSNYLHLKNLDDRPFGLPVMDCPESPEVVSPLPATAWLEPISEANAPFVAEKDDTNFRDVVVVGKPPEVESASKENILVVGGGGEPMDTGIMPAPVQPVIQQQSILQSLLNSDEESSIHAPTPTAAPVGTTVVPVESRELSVTYAKKKKRPPATLSQVVGIAWAKRVQNCCGRELKPADDPFAPPNWLSTASITHDRFKNSTPEDISSIYRSTALRVSDAFDFSSFPMPPTKPISPQSIYNDDSPYLPPVPVIWSKKSRQKKRKRSPEIIEEIELPPIRLPPPPASPVRPKPRQPPQTPPPPVEKPSVDQEMDGTGSRVENLEGAGNDGSQAEMSGPGGGGVSHHEYSSQLEMALNESEPRLEGHSNFEAIIERVPNPTATEFMQNPTSGTGTGTSSVEMNAPLLTAALNQDDSLVNMDVVPPLLAPTKVGEPSTSTSSTVPQSSSSTVSNFPGVQVKSEPLSGHASPAVMNPGFVPRFPADMMRPPTVMQTQAEGMRPPPFSMQQQQQTGSTPMMAPPPPFPLQQQQSQTPVTMASSSESSNSVMRSLLAQSPASDANVGMNSFPTMRPPMSPTAANFGMERGMQSFSINPPTMSDTPTEFPTSFTPEAPAPAPESAAAAINDDAEMQSIADPTEAADRENTPPPKRSKYFISLEQVKKIEEVTRERLLPLKKLTEMVLAHRPKTRGPISKHRLSNRFSAIPVAKNGQLKAIGSAIYSATGFYEPIDPKSGGEGRHDARKYAVAKRREAELKRKARNAAVPAPENVLNVLDQKSTENVLDNAAGGLQGLQGGNERQFARQWPMGGPRMMGGPQMPPGMGMGFGPPPHGFRPPNMGGPPGVGPGGPPGVGPGGMNYTGSPFSTGGFYRNESPRLNLPMSAMPMMQMHRSDSNLNLGGHAMMPSSVSMSQMNQNPMGPPGFMVCGPNAGGSEQQQQQQMLQQPASAAGGLMMRPGPGSIGPAHPASMGPGGFHHMPSMSAPMSYNSPQSYSVKSSIISPLTGMGNIPGGTGNIGIGSNMGAPGSMSVGPAPASVHATMPPGAMMGGPMSSIHPGPGSMHSASSMAPMSTGIPQQQQSQQQQPQQQPMNAVPFPGPGPGSLSAMMQQSQQPQTAASVSAAGGLMGAPAMQALLQPQQHLPVPAGDVELIESEKLFKQLQNGVGVIIAVLLKDTTFDLYYDTVFDSCPMCSCTESIRTTEYGVYLSIPPDACQVDRVQNQFSEQNVIANCFSGFMIKNASQKCSCAFSAVRHRYICEFNSNLFVDDINEAVGYPAITKAQKPRVQWFNVCSEADWTLMDMMRWYMLGHDVAQFIKAGHYVGEVPELTDASMMKTVDTGSQAYIVPGPDQNELNFVVSTSIDASLINGGHDFFRFSKNRPQHELVPYVHPWGIQIANTPTNPPTATEFDGIMSTVLRIIAIPRKHWREDQSDVDVAGPLTWREMHRLATERYRQPLKEGEEDLTFEPEPLPNVLLGTDRELMRLSPAVVWAWDRLGLAPYSWPKNVLYIAVLPELPIVVEKCRDFMDDLRTVYERCRLGRHLPVPSKGMDALGLTAESFLRIPCTLDREVKPTDTFRVGLVDRTKIYVNRFIEIVSAFFKSTSTVFSKNCYFEAAYRDLFAEFEKNPCFLPPPVEGKPAAALPAGELHMGSVNTGYLPTRQNTRGNEPNGENPLDDPNSEDSIRNGVETFYQADEGNQVLDHMVVVYVVNPFDYGTDSCDESNAKSVFVRLLRAFNSIIRELPFENRPRVQFEIIPMRTVLDYAGVTCDPVHEHVQKLSVPWLCDSMTSTDILKNLSFTVYSQPRNVTSDCVKSIIAKSMTRFGPASQVRDILDSVTVSTPEQYHRIPMNPFILAPRMNSFEIKKGRCVVKNPEEKVLFVTYCLIEDEYIIASVTDDRGQLADTIVLSLYRRTNAKNVHSGGTASMLSHVGDAIQRLWQYIQGVMSLDTKNWRLVIGRFGKLGHGEFKAWTHILSKKNLQTYNLMLKGRDKDLMTPAPISGGGPGGFSAMGGPGGVGCGLGGTCRTCSISHGYSETPALITACLVSTEAEAFLRVMQKFMPDLNSKIRNLHNDHSITHIVVFPTSPYISNSQDQGLIEGEDDADVDFMDANFDTGDNDLSEMGLENIADLEFEGEGPTTTLFSNQPIAVGYSVSTAPAQDVPEWFWAMCPNARNRTPVHLKSSLHITIAHVQQADDLTMSNAVSHPLDSSATDEVLKYILQTYNDLSWLNLDFMSGQRRSCLPIHIQNLVRLYNGVTSTLY